MEMKHADFFAFQYAKMTTIIEYFQEKARLAEPMLLLLAHSVAATAMESIAIAHMGISSAEIKNLKQRPEIVGEKLSFELLRKWKNREKESTKEVYHYIKSQFSAFTCE